MRIYRLLGVAMLTALGVALPDAEATKDTVGPPDARLHVGTKAKTTGPYMAEWSGATGDGGCVTGGGDGPFGRPRPLRVAQGQRRIVVQLLGVQARPARVSVAYSKQVSAGGGPRNSREAHVRIRRRAQGADAPRRWAAIFRLRADGTVYLKVIARYAGRPATCGFANSAAWAFAIRGR